jgi:hypothetical protein
MRGAAASPSPTTGKFAPWSRRRAPRRRFPDRCNPRGMLLPALPGPVAAPARFTVLGVAKLSRNAEIPDDRTTTR